jgi:transcriptional regulator with XRE-family HTH domain
MVHQQHQRLQELGDFLRTRRARLAPEDVGFPRGSRRRAPGLTRAEVAQLAGASLDWYTWLEQGRPINPSTQVLESLVRALRLDANERQHLFFLAHQQPPPVTKMEFETVSPALQRYLDHLGNSPAFVTGKQWDILAWNDFRRVSVGERNMIWHLFTNPSFQQLIVDWEGHARRILAEFRASCAHYLESPRLTELIQNLILRSPEFRAWWPDHEVLGAPEGQKKLNHPRIGSLVFDHLAFQVFDAPDLKVTVYTPLKEANTSRKMDQLLDQWYQYEGQGLQTPAATYDLTQTQPSGQDSVGLWLEACCKRVAEEWVANSRVMISYVNWCEAHGYEPKKAKGLAQSLVAHGIEVGVRKWVYTEPGIRTKTRGVRGLSLQNCNQTEKTSGDR